MGWTNPKTWSSGETLTAANFNTHIRDNLNATWHLIARKTADQSVTSSTALVTDTHLTLAVAINEIWALRWMLLITAGTTGDFKFAYSFPSGTAYTHAVLTDESGTPVENQQIIHASSDANSSSTLGFGAIRLYSWDTYFTNGGTAGTFALRWAQDASSATPTSVLTNSVLLGMKIA